MVRAIASGEAGGAEQCVRLQEEGANAFKTEHLQRPP